MFGNRPLTMGGFRTNSTVFITFFNLINSLVKHFQNSQITKGRNSFTHIQKDSILWVERAIERYKYTKREILKI